MPSIIFTHSQGSGQPNINSQIVNQIKISLPPLPEQHRIATVLGTIDECIEKTEALIAKLKQMKAGLMQDLLTRGIDEKGRIRDESTHEFKDTEIGRVPVEWDVITLGDQLLKIEQGWSPDCENYPARNEQWGVLKTTSVIWSGYQENENKALPSNLNPLPQYEVKPGDLLMTRGGPNSRVGVVAFVYSTQSKLMLSDKLYRIISNQSIDSEYLYFSLSSSSIQTQLSGLKTGLAESQTNISQEIVRKLKVALPPKNEQMVIAQKIRQIYSVEKSNQKYLEKLIYQKKGLMSDLLTGKVRVPTNFALSD